MKKKTNKIMTNDKKIRLLVEKAFNKTLEQMYKKGYITKPLQRNSFKADVEFIDEV